MTLMNEATALSLLFANTKRKKRSVDLITLAQSCKYLVDLYGSKKAVAEKVGLSTEMIRELMLPLEVPKEVQTLISSRKIDSIDKVREISVLKAPSKQIAAAKEVVNTPTKDVRDMKRLIERTGVSPKKAKEIILEAKPKDLHIFLIDFDEEVYHSILEHAKRKKLDPAQLVKEIVCDWLRKEKPTDKNEEDS
jgi:DNA uptake protein ComE-like DNA-binding protein